MKKAYSANVNVDCSYYPEQGKYALVNNTDQSQETVFYNVQGNKEKLVLSAGDILWFSEKCNV